jgi:hypothetical protein
VYGSRGTFGRLECGPMKLQTFRTAVVDRTHQFESWIWTF